MAPTKRKPGARTYASYSNETLERALHDIKNKRMSLRKASVTYKISLGTLSRKSRQLQMNSYGRPTVLSKQLENRIVEGLQVAAEWGFPLTVRDLQCVVQSYLEQIGKREPRFKQNMPGKNWVVHFRNRHPQLTNRLSENIKRNRAEVSHETISAYFENLELSLRDVPPEALINYDESNLTDDPGRSKVLVKRGVKHPERCLDSSKMSISIMFACSASGVFLPPYIIYKAEHLYDSWTERGPKGARYNRSKSGWMDSNLFEDWFLSILLPYMKKLGPGPKAVIGDNLSSHLSQNVIKECQSNNIRFILLPANSTHLCQPLDVSVFRSLKAAWRKQLLQWKLSNKGCVPKSQFPSLLRETLETINENLPTIIQSGFRATGIHPIDKTQVLKRLPGGSNEDPQNETALATVLKTHLTTMRYGKEKPPERKKKRIAVAPGKSISGIGETSSSSDEEETNISLHDTDSSVGLEDFSDLILDQDLDQDNLEDETTYGNTAAENLDENEVNSSQNETQEVQLSKDNEIREGSFVLVAFPLQGKAQKFRNFVGEVLNVREGGCSYECKFLRNLRMSKVNFTYPDVEDVCVVEKNQIIQRLIAKKESSLKVVLESPVDV